MAYVETSLLTPNNFNPNVVGIDAEERLSASVGKLGLFQPIVVRDVHGSLEILSGENRWRLAKESGLETVPVINLGEVPEKEAREICLIANGSYGENDESRLASILREIGDSSVLPFEVEDISRLLSDIGNDMEELNDIDADDLDLPDQRPTEKLSIKSHEVFRFAIPVEFKDMVMDKITEKIADDRLTEGTGAQNMGMALAMIFQDLEDE